MAGAVEVAATGEEGLELAMELVPDAITLDAIMPDTDGWTVLGRLKSHPELSKIPIIMISMIDDRSRGFSLGASEYLTKPVEQDQLLRVLEKHTGGLSKTTVLVVDDDEGHRRNLGRLLEREGLVFEQASDGRDALSVISREVPDLILLDLMMPVMDGFEFLEELRRRKEYQSIPVVVLTSKDLDQTDRDRLTGSVTRILQKGVVAREQLIGELKKELSSRLSA
ncbi:MAG: response regulator [Thermoanaerobaculia bacterium]|nr:response regulator [Thermoanaerobaculia bacterium]